MSEAETKTNPQVERDLLIRRAMGMEHTNSTIKAAELALSGADFETLNSLHALMIDTEIPNHIAGWQAAIRLGIATEEELENYGYHTLRCVASGIRGMICTDEEVFDRMRTISRRLGPVMRYLTEENPFLIDFINSYTASGSSYGNTLNRLRELYGEELPVEFQELSPEALRKLARKHSGVFIRNTETDFAYGTLKFHGEKRENIRKRIAYLRNVELLSYNRITQILSKEIGEKTIARETIMEIIRDDQYNPIQDERIAALGITLYKHESFSRHTPDEFLSDINRIQGAIYNWCLEYGFAYTDIDLNERIDESILPFFQSDQKINSLFNGKYWKFRQFVRSLISRGVLTVVQSSDWE